MCSVSLGIELLLFHRCGGDRPPVQETQNWSIVSLCKTFELMSPVFTPRRRWRFCIQVLLECGMPQCKLGVWEPTMRGFIPFGLWVPTVYDSFCLLWLQNFMFSMATTQPRRGAKICLIPWPRACDGICLWNLWPRAACTVRQWL